MALPSRSTVGAVQLRVTVPGLEALSVKLRSLTSAGVLMPRKADVSRGCPAPKALLAVMV